MTQNRRKSNLREVIETSTEREGGREGGSAPIHDVTPHLRESQPTNQPNKESKQAMERAAKKVIESNNNQPVIPLPSIKTDRRRLQKCEGGREGVDGGQLISSQSPEKYVNWKCVSVSRPTYICMSTNMWLMDWWSGRETGREEERREPSAREEEEQQICFIKRPKVR